jgi:type II restriction enzyme
MKAQQLLEQVLQVLPTLSPSKNAVGHWSSLNKVFLSFSKKIDAHWKTEKIVSVESIDIAKEEALTFLAQEREKIMRMSHAEALQELIKVHKIESRIKTINAISDNGLFTIK